MIAKELISDVVVPVKTSDTGEYALREMQIFKVSHLPIVNNKQFLGLISENDIFDLNETSEPLGNHKLSLMSPYVKENQHVYEVIELVSSKHISLIPVLDNDNNYLGSIILQDLLQAFARITAVDKQGSIIVLEMNLNDFALSEISQIVEGNDCKIISLYVTSNEDSTKLEVTLKINKTDINPIIQSFNRYNYDIKASYLVAKDIEDLYKDRYDLLMRYINV